MDSRHGAWSSFVVVAIAAAMSLGSSGLSTAWAQLGKADPERQVNNIFLPAPRELGLRLTHARKAIENEEYAEAVNQLGRLLLELEEQPAGDEPGTEQPQDYFIGPRGDQGTLTSLKTEAQRLIGSMPAKGREWYELQFGAQARVVLEEAVAQNDAAKLTAVSRRFFHTKAGYEATLLLGRYYLDRGQPLAAALSLKRLSDSPAATDFEPELSLLLSTCWIQANQPEKAQQTLVELRKRQPNLRWRVGGEAVQLPKEDAQTLPWLEKIVGLVRRTNLSDALQWILYRGNATRNALSVGDMPLSKARWRVRTLNDPNDEKMIDQAEKRMLAGSTPSLPAFQPLAVRDTVLMRTPQQLLGVDFRTGKIVWEFPWDSMDLPSVGTPTFNPRIPSAQSSTSQRELELRQRLWEDAPYGQFSSDGETVYLIHGLKFSSPNQQFMGGFIGPNGRGPRGPTASNRLVALDLKREGSYQWVVGDDQGGGGDEPKLAGAFFLGPPLPLQGQLFVLAEINSQIQLVVLNAKTGRLEWQQQLAQFDNRSILTDSQRRLAGASPSYADGVIVCPTSAGAVVAVDVANRTLLWGYQYAQNSGDPRQMRFHNGVPVQPKAYGNRWLDSTITIHDGYVVLTPLESDELIVLELLTGKLAWPAKKREEMLYVAGIQNGNLIMVGRRQIAAFKLSDGSPAWPPLELPESGMPSGRGILSQGEYFLPTSASQLVRVDIKTGKLIEAIRTEKILGNLISYRDEIVSHGVDGLSAYHMVTPLRAKVTNALEKNPEDGWALARLGELQLYDGKRAESLETLRRAMRLNPEDESLRNLLVSTLLTVLRDDFARHRGLAPEIEQLATLPNQRAEFLRLMAEGMKQAGETEAAFDAFLNLAGVQQLLAGGANLAPPTEQLSRTYSVRRDRWIQANLAEIYSAAMPAQREKMDAAIEQLRGQALAATDLAVTRHFLRYFGFHRTADRVRLEVAARMIDTDSLLEAELLLAPLEAHADRELAAGAVAETARLLLRARLLDQAAAYYARLVRDYSEVPCRGGLTGAQCAAAAAQDPQFQKVAQEQAWPYGRVGITEAENRQLANANYGRSFPLQLRDALGATPIGLQVAYDMNRNQSVIARDGVGREILNVQVTRPDGRLPYFFNSTQHLSQVRARGHLLVMNLGIEVVALSTLKAGNRFDDALRWRQEMATFGPDANRTLPRFQTSVTSTPWGFSRYSVTLVGEDAPVSVLGPVTSHGVFFQKQRELVAVDLLTGETLWTRSDLPLGCELFGDDELLFVVPPKSVEALVLSPLDGRDIGKRKVEPLENRWLTSGRRMLTWSQAGNVLWLKLTDVWSGKTLVDANFPVGSRGVPVGHDEIAVLHPEGALTIYSLMDGRPTLQAKLEPEPQLQSLLVQRSEDTYLVAAGAPPSANTNGVDYTPVQGSINSQIFSGKVYSFDRRSGRANWPVPAVVDQYGLPGDQPSEAPAIVFLRNVRSRGRNSNTPQTSVLVLDKRDGRTLLNKDDIPVQANFYEIAADAEKKQLVIQLGVKLFTLLFTSEPVAPEPPAQTGGKSNRPPMAAPGRRGIIAALGDQLDEFDELERSQAVRVGLVKP